jgi:hypothetical protein
MAKVAVFNVAPSQSLSGKDWRLSDRRRPDSPLFSARDDGGSDGMDGQTPVPDRSQPANASNEGLIGRPAG